jgi:hypothetical protein
MTALCLAVSLGGCGTDHNKPPLGKVRGKVTYNGQPVTSGSVTFTPIAGQGAATGQPATGQIESDGSYELTTFNTGDGAILGQHAVTVHLGGQGSTPAKKANTGRIIYEMPKSPIPSKYASVSTTPLKHTVEAGSNTIDLPLKD